MATETTQSGASNCAEGLCLLCEGRFSPGELYRMFFWSRQGKQQQLCTSSWGGMYLCVRLSVRLSVCNLGPDSIYERSRMCARKSKCVCACSGCGADKAGHTESTDQVITQCRPFTKSGGEKKKEEKVCWLGSETKKMEEENGVNKEWEKIIETQTTEASLVRLCCFMNSQTRL